MIKYLIPFLLFLFIPTMVFAETGNGVSYSSGSSGEGGDLFFLIYLFLEHPYLFIGFIILHFVLKKTTGFDLLRFVMKNRFGSTTTERVHKNTQQSIQYDRKSISRLKEKDPHFSDEAFLSKVNNMYIQLQEAWMNKQWKKIRPFETDTLFNMHEKQLQQYIQKQQTNIVENIGILHSEIVRYESEGMNDEIDVKLKVRINDYIVDDQTNKILKGNPNLDIYMTYIWTLIRKAHVLTDIEKKSNTVTQCPNCGANVSINATGECEYCESVISNGDHDWVLSKITVLEQS